MNTNPPLESPAARAWGKRVYTASAPESPQYHPGAGFRARESGVTLAISSASPRLWPRIAPPSLGPGRPSHSASRICASATCASASLQRRPPPGSDKRRRRPTPTPRSEEHTSELQSRLHLVCRLLLEKKKNKQTADNVKEELSTSL